ncbi:MAG: hypothetical protein U1E78_09000 [Gammaproteobacteria bacterium]
MIFRVPPCALRASAGMGAERSSRRSVHKVHDCGENREGNPPTFFELRADATDGQANPENSAVKGIA